MVKFIFIVLKKITTNNRRKELELIQLLLEIMHCAHNLQISQSSASR